MKKILRSLLAAVILCGTFGFTKTVAHASEGVAMNRLYNPNSGEHFYTGSNAEKDTLVSLGWSYEGIGWTAPTSSNTPVYRMYNGNAGEHHYTTSANERDYLVSVGWSYEGIGWYSDDNQGTPLYREYNPNQYACNHNYTTSKAENDWLVSLGWSYEGVAWYGVNENAAPAPSSNPVSGPTEREKAAVTSLQSYVSRTHESEEWTREDLKAEGYSQDEINYAVANSGIDWNANALEYAKENVQGNTKNNVILNMKSDKFTQAQIDSVIPYLDTVDYNQMAVIDAKRIVKTLGETDLAYAYSWLLKDGFTEEQAQYAANYKG